LAPFSSQGSLPVDIWLDAVAIADVDCCFAVKTLGRPMQCRDPPFCHFFHIDVEGGLVELDHVDADPSQLAGLVV
jgi:hypothetical protein